MRTLSKTHGLAGIRVGYGFAPEWLADAMDRARMPFNVNALAQVGAIAALNDDEHVRRTVANNARGLARMAEGFVLLGIKPVQSQANFILGDLGRPARPVFEELLRHGVIVRPGDVLGCPTCLRVSVGTEDEVSRFISALEKVLAPQPA
jgi:histidinol-phosphate aminotransferase